MSRRRQWVMAGALTALAGALIASRVLPAPKYLYFFDSVNFALALEDFNPARHQPQPPGYPWFVLLAKLAYGLAGNPPHAFLIVAILGSAAALALVWRLGCEMFGARAGLFAMLFLLFHPTFWFGALTNQVRVFLAVAGAVVLLGGWRSLQEASPKWFYATSASIGLLSGFRPDTLVFAAPLLIYAGVRGRRTAGQWAAAAGLLAAAAGIWIAFVAIEVGGPGALAALIREYCGVQFGDSSALFGAAPQAARRMFRMALVWYGIPVLTWLVFVPLARGIAPPLRPAAGLFAMAVVPAFVFHAAVHVGDPDHTLFAAPALCLIGGLVVSRIRRAPAFAAAVVALNVTVFFAPPRGIARACGYPAVRSADVATRQTFRAIDRVRGGGPLTIVLYDHWISWRHLYYYYPDIPLLVLRHDPRSNPDPQSAWMIYQRQVHPPPLVDGQIQLPAGRTVWLLSRGRGMHRLLASSLALAQPLNSVAYAELRAGAAFRFGGYRFAPL